MAQPALHGPSKLVKGSAHRSHTSPAKSGKPVKQAHISLHQKHNKGVKQPFLAAQAGQNEAY